MNFRQAYEKELERGLRVIYAAQDATCEICGKCDELRIGVCFDCKPFLETDMIEAWDRRHPEKRWPYAWVAQPALEATEPERAIALRLAESLHSTANIPLVRAAPELLRACKRLVAYIRADDRRQNFPFDCVEVEEAEDAIQKAENGE